MKEVHSILLTGASGGIGAATRAALEKEGFCVVGIERNDADLSQYEDIRKLASKFDKEKTVFDWIVFAHGFIDTEFDLTKQRKENIDTTFAVNTLSIIYLTQMLMSRIRKGVIFVSSYTAVKPNGRYAVYSASKAAVNGFSQALARNRPELSFIAVCPSATNTPMRRKIASDADSSQSPAVVGNVIANIVAGSSAYKSGDIVVIKNGEDSLQGSTDK